MFIFNVKLNKNSILKTSLVIMFIIVIGIGIAGVYNVIIKTKSTENNVIQDTIPSSEIAEILPQNYTNILKAVHENIDTYIGQKIKFSGYVYRLNGFNENQFVLARDMDIGNKQTVIVGFLCESEKSKEFEKELNELNDAYRELTGEEIRNAFSLRSSAFKITTTENEVTFKVSGYGHGVGMSQYGADFMARQGSTYEEILKHYYKNTEIQK